MTILAYLVGYFLIFPIATFLHELGHAIPALLLTDKPVIVHLGSFRTDRPRLKLGRLEIILGYTPRPMSPMAGLVKFDRSAVTPQSEVKIMAGGPLVSLGIMLAAAYASADPFQALLWEFAAINGLLSFLMTALPITYPRWMGIYAGRISDGKRIQQLWQRRQHAEQHL